MNIKKRKDWAFASLVKDLDYKKTGISQYAEKKEYYSTGSIKNTNYTSEGIYSFTERPSRANRIGIIGDVLQARMKETDKAIIINEKLNQQLFSTGFFQVKPSKKTILSEYLFYYFKSSLFLNEKDKNCSGSTQSALNDKSAENLLIPIAPLPIQRSIVSKIESLFSDLDNGIANLKKAQEQLKIYRQAVLKKAFEGELTKEWRKKQTNLPIAEELLQQIKEERQNRYNKQIEDWKKAVKKWELTVKTGHALSQKKPTKPKAPKELPPLTEDELKELPKLPEGWVTTRMENVSLNITDGDHQAPPKASSGIPFITISNIKNNRIDFSNTFFVDDEYYNSLIKYRVPKKGDILYTVTGSFGIPVIINFEKDFCFQRHIGLIRPLNIINSKWMYWLLQSQIIYNQALKKATGTAQKTIGLASIRSFATPLCSIQEQNQIVQEIETRLSVCDKVEQSITESLEKAKALRQSILKKAFEGKLLSEQEIKQCKKEKDYDPASVLLEKIKAEKLAKEQGKKNSKKKGRK